MNRIIAWLERIPYELVALVARAATFVVFWRSGQVKLDDWSATLGLFETEYALPLLPPQLAAWLATGLELGGSVLVLLGLGTRFAALALLGMVVTIQLLVYPAHGQRISSGSPSCCRWSRAARDACRSTRCWPAGCVHEQPSSAA